MLPTRYSNETGVGKDPFFPYQVKSSQVKSSQVKSSQVKSSRKASRERTLARARLHARGFVRGRDAPLRRPSTCGARRSLDSAEDPSPDAESSEPSVATELGVSPMEDDETELDDASPVFDHEAAPVLAESAAPALMTTDEATEALDILHHLRPCLPTGKTLAAEVDRLELDLQRAILIPDQDPRSGGVRARTTEPGPAHRGCAKRDMQARLPKLRRGAVQGAGHRKQSHALDPPIAAQAESPVNTDGEMEVEEEQGTPEFTFMKLRYGRFKFDALLRPSGASSPRSMRRRLSSSLLAEFTATCAAKSIMVNAAANAKGAVVITKATRSAGAPASVVPWDVVKAVARTVFGHCTSVAAVKGGAPRPISTNTPLPPQRLCLA